MKKNFLIISILASSLLSFSNVETKDVETASSLAMAMDSIAQVQADKNFAIGIGGSYIKSEDYSQNNFGSGAIALGVSGSDTKNFIVYNVKGAFAFKNHKWSDFQEDIKAGKTKWGLSTGLTFNFGDKEKKEVQKNIMKETKENSPLLDKEITSKISSLEKENNDQKELLKLQEEKLNKQNKEIEKIMKELLALKESYNVEITEKNYVEATKLDELIKEINKLKVENANRIAQIEKLVENDKKIVSEMNKFKEVYIKAIKQYNINTTNLVKRISDLEDFKHETLKKELEK